eukprot:scaffold37804_cov62-Attheya_sp.AAC.7
MMGGRNEQSANRQGRRIAAVQTVQHIKTNRPGNSKNLEAFPNTKAKNECDTNANTCCLGTTFVILDYTMRTADVYAYDRSIKPIENVPIV